MAAFGTYRWFDPMRALAQAADRRPTAMVISGTKIIMRQPRLTGYTKDERPYTVTARTAAKDLTNPDVLELEDIHTTIVMQDGRNVELTATEGFYDGKAETLRLHERRRRQLARVRGARCSDALVHVRAGNVVSEQAGRGQDAAGNASTPIGSRCRNRARSSGSSAA